MQQSIASVDASGGVTGASISGTANTGSASTLGGPIKQTTRVLEHCTRSTLSQLITQK